MNKHYQIRLAQQSELLRLNVIEEAASTLFTDTKFALEIDQEPLSLDLLQEQQQAGLIWVATDEQNYPVGFVVAMRMEHGFQSPLNSPVLHLHELSVDTEHTRQGLGTRLTRQVIQHAKDSGYSRVTLSTFRDIPWNAPFYKRLGFREMKWSEMGTDLLRVRVKEKQVGLPMTERILMVLELPTPL